MRQMKEAGPRELDALRRRTLKSLAMGRIDKPDCDYIVGKLDDIEARIQTMVERNPNDKEAF